MTQTTNNKTLLVAGAVTVGLIGSAYLFYKYVIKSNRTGRLMGASQFVSKLTNTALEEYKAWGNGTIKEGDKRTMDRLKKYWTEGAGVKGLTEKQMVDLAWSAAFISYLMRTAGAGTDWKYNQSHSVYIVDSINNKKANNGKPFKGYKPEEVKVEVGDLVGFARQAGVTYDTPATYMSHTDLVIAIKDGYAEAIGGNVSNSVTITRVPLTADGKIDLKKAPKYFVVIKNGK